MLREHYPIDKLFKEVLGYVPEMAPELVKIDIYLEDEKLYRLIKKNLSQRRPKTLQTGRNSTPVDVVLRMLVVVRCKILMWTLIYKSEWRLLTGFQNSPSVLSPLGIYSSLRSGTRLPNTTMKIWDADSGGTSPRL